MAGMFSGHGGHGHSHAGGAECQGHHGMEDMPEEVRQRLLKQLEARMRDTKSHEHSHNHSPGVDNFEPEPLRVSYNPLLYGYGHEPLPPPTGWDGLAKMTSLLPGATGGEVCCATRDTPRDNFWSVSVPFLGRLRVVKDRQGWVMASCVLLYWIYGNWSTWMTILLPYYHDGVLSSFHLLTYACVSVMCIASFFRAATMNPGSLQTSHQTPQETWTDCRTCDQKRPPLCHHCRRCGQCVRKMDHHCPWINNCVGEENQFAFIQLLVYACLLSIHTLALQAAHFFWLGGCKTCDQDSFVIYYRTPIIVICVVMATFMTVSMAGLCLTQHISITHGTTTVEWMKLQQQIFVTGIIPENIPEQTKTCCHTYSILCGSRRAYLWPFPCRRRLTTVEKASVV